MATFWKIAAPSVNHVFFLYLDYLLFYSFEDMILVLVVPDSGHCLPFNFFHHYSSVTSVITNSFRKQRKHKGNQKDVQNQHDCHLALLLNGCGFRLLTPSDVLDFHKKRFNG